MQFFPQEAFNYVFRYAKGPLRREAKKGNDRYSVPARHPTRPRRAYRRAANRARARIKCVRCVTRPRARARALTSCDTMALTSDDRGARGAWRECVLGEYPLDSWQTHLTCSPSSSPAPTRPSSYIRDSSETELSASVDPIVTTRKHSALAGTVLDCPTLSRFARASDVKRRIVGVTV